jgi:hypothetical protein
MQIMRRILTVLCLIASFLVAREAFAVSIEANDYNLFPDHTETELWNAHIQSTYVSTVKDHFDESYQGTNSLLNQGDISRSYTGSVTAYFGVHLWQGAEYYLNPEAFVGIPFSGLHGMGGFPNGELQKGAEIPASYYLARSYIRQTFNLGGETTHLHDAPNQLSTNVTNDRVQLTYGIFSLLDYFDNNSLSHDPRTQFLNWTIMTSGAYDFAADTRGYTYGGVVEYFKNDWVIRAAHVAMPKVPDLTDLDNSLSHDYGDQVEVTHDLLLDDQTGKIRVLLFSNHGFMGRYKDALNASPSNPDLLQVRRDGVTKWGYALNLEQNLNDQLGVFLRWSWNDGQSETEAFTDVSHSFSGGTVLKGMKWHRPEDVIGLGFAVNGINASEIQYLQQGGLTPFLGDGHLNYANERIIEMYYSAQILKGAFATLDYQHTENPGYNQDRGSVDFLSIRLHYEM